MQNTGEIKWLKTVYRKVQKLFWPLPQLIFYIFHYLRTCTKKSPPSVYICLLGWFQARSTACLFLRHQHPILRYRIATNSRNHKPSRYHQPKSICWLCFIVSCCFMVFSSKTYTTWPSPLQFFFKSRAVITLFSAQAAEYLPIYCKSLRMAYGCGMLWLLFHDVFGFYHLFCPVLSQGGDQHDPNIRWSFQENS